MTRLSRRFLSLLLLAGVSVPAAVASNKDNPKEILHKAFQQANLWTQGPVKLTAIVTLPHANRDGSDATLHYLVSWAGPEKWRVEWPENGLNQIAVLNNNKLYYSSGQPNPIIPLVQFESAVAALDGGNPAGPYLLPPVDLEKAKFDSIKKKIDNVEAKCFSFGDPQRTYCLDPVTDHLLSVSTTVSGAEVGLFEYSDYATADNVQYPQTIKVSYAGKPLVSGKMTIARDQKFTDKDFAAPDKGTSTDWPSCPDVGKNFTAPTLSKSVPAKMPDAARKAKKYGLVWVVAIVDKNGSVTKATSIGGDPDLTSAATDAVQHYQFTPYERCAHPVGFQTLIFVPFTPKLPTDYPSL